MNDHVRRDDSGDHPSTPEQDAARAAVRALGVPQASPQFRTRMREAFVTGALDEKDPANARKRPAAVVRGAVRVRRWTWTGAMALAAVLVLMIGLANRGAGWTITGVGANVTVLINGREVSCADLSPIEAALRPGCHIVVPAGGRMELANADVFLLELGGGTEITLPRAPGRWFARDVASRVGGRGTLRVATAQGFAGATYRLQTSSAELVVTGTAFTVIQAEDSVCLCVLEGEVRASLPDGTTTSVGPGRRVFVSAADGMVDHGPMLESEREALLALRARADALATPR